MKVIWGLANAKWVTWLKYLSRDFVHESFKRYLSIFFSFNVYFIFESERGREHVSGEGQRDRQTDFQAGSRT